MSTDIKDILERKEYATQAVMDIRAEAATDMRFVSGDPWDGDDREMRKGRPTIAPEEMGQYFNHVINSLRSNPRGARFAPVGNGANDKTAEWYQDKSREIEYRSNAENAYLVAAENCIQRSYGFVRVSTRFASPRSANQEIWIESMPDPDMVLPDPDAKLPDSSDQQFCFVLEWSHRDEVKRKSASYLGKSVAESSTTYGSAGWSAAPKGWFQGNQELLAEYWSIETRKRKLLLVNGPNGSQPMQLFDDEFKQLQGHGLTVARELRDVDYPFVQMCMTDGREILKTVPWAGKYIPIVSCYGKIIYVPEGGEVKKKILSMTRFGRDPWKAYCYACSQELEVLGQVPKTTVLAAAGQLDKYSKDWEESRYKPKAFLYYDAKLPGTLGEQLLPPPQMMDYTGGQHLQALELVKEGFRRAIQSAMGSNFMPTQAQRRNEKSGKALEKIDNAAAIGTYHFVYAYDAMIRQVGIVEEDLFDKIYDFAGETGTMKADGKAKMTSINVQGDPESISTKGDYLVTVSTAPSSDSEHEAVSDFTDTLVQNIGMVVQLSGPKVAAAILAKSIRMKVLGPLGDAIADLIEPPEYKQQDGVPPNPETMALQAQIQQLQQQLQQAGMEKQGKVVEQQGKMEIVKVQEQAETAREQATNETRLAIATLAGKFETLQNAMNLFMQERTRLGVQAHEVASDVRQAAHEVRMAAHGHAHEVALGAADAAVAERQAAAAADALKMQQDSQPLQ